MSSLKQHKEARPKRERCVSFKSDSLDLQKRILVVTHSHPPSKSYWQKLRLPDGVTDQVHKILGSLAAEIQTNFVRSDHLTVFAKDKYFDPEDKKFKIYSRQSEMGTSKGQVSLIYSIHFGRQVSSIKERAKEKKAFVAAHAVAKPFEQPKKAPAPGKQRVPPSTRELRDEEEDEEDRDDQESEGRQDGEDEEMPDVGSRGFVGSGRKAPAPRRELSDEEDDEEDPDDQEGEGSQDSEDQEIPDVGSRGVNGSGKRKEPSPRRELSDEEEDEEDPDDQEGEGSQDSEDEEMPDVRGRGFVGSGMRKEPSPRRELSDDEEDEEDLDDQEGEGSQDSEDEEMSDVGGRGVNGSGMRKEPSPRLEFSDDGGQFGDDDQDYVPGGGSQQDDEDVVEQQLREQLKGAPPLDVPADDGDGSDGSSDVEVIEARGGKTEHLKKIPKYISAKHAAFAEFKNLIEAERQRKKQRKWRVTPRQAETYRDSLNLQVEWHKSGGEEGEYQWKDLEVYTENYNTVRSQFKLWWDPLGVRGVLERHEIIEKSDPKPLPSLTREDVIGFFSKYASPDDKEEVREMVVEETDHWLEE
jgi:hypothetical protein